MVICARSFVGFGVDWIYRIYQAVPKEAIYLIGRSHGYIFIGRVECFRSGRDKLRFWLLIWSKFIDCLGIIPSVAKSHRKFAFTKEISWSADEGFSCVCVLSARASVKSGDITTHSEGILIVWISVAILNKVWFTVVKLHISRKKDTSQEKQQQTA